jgi:NAD(P)-dependent dehydrogenase (short-subunit alcohol dehydrogenase family)
VAPGPVSTDNVPTGTEANALLNFFLERTRAENRVGTVNDIAVAVLLLASEKSRWITGQVINVSGGINGG